VSHLPARIRKLFRSAFALLAVAAALTVLVLPAPQAFAQAQQPATCDQERRTKVRATVTTEHERLANATFWWSTAVGVTQYGSIVLSLLAAFLVKTEWLEKRTKNVTTAMTSISALFITASAAGGFHEKWQANRLATAEARNLTLELDKSNVDCDAVLTRLQELSRRSNDSIIAAGTGIQPVPTD
jgi:hypothetical protein